MHTHFATDFQSQLSTLSSASSGINDKGVSDALTTLSRSSMFNRVVQANGLSLLFLLLLMACYMVVVRCAGGRAGGRARVCIYVLVTIPASSAHTPAGHLTSLLPAASLGMPVQPSQAAVHSCRHLLLRSVIMSPRHHDQHMLWPPRPQHPAHCLSTRHPCRYLMWGVFGRAFERCCSCSLLACLFNHAPDSSTTYQGALCSRPCALSGTATYRLPHHPRYKEAFKNPLYKPIWFKAFGTERYTRLVSCWLVMSIAGQPVHRHRMVQASHGIQYACGPCQWHAFTCTRYLCWQSLQLCLR
jgi:hypothetical protein